MVRHSPHTLEVMGSNQAEPPLAILSFSCVTSFGSHRWNARRYRLFSIKNHWRIFKVSENPPVEGATAKWSCFEPLHNSADYQDIVEAARRWMINVIKLTLKSRKFLSKKFLNTWSSTASGSVDRYTKLDSEEAVHAPWMQRLFASMIVLDSTTWRQPTQHRNAC